MSRSKIYDDNMWLLVNMTLCSLIGVMVTDYLPSRWGSTFALVKAQQIQESLDIPAKNVGFLGEEHFLNGMHNIGGVGLLRLMNFRCVRCLNEYVHTSDDSDITCDSCKGV